jgi:hypothetical protein
MSSSPSPLIRFPLSNLLPSFLFPLSNRLQRCLGCRLLIACFLALPMLSLPHPPNPTYGSEILIVIVINRGMRTRQPLSSQQISSLQRPLFSRGSQSTLMCTCDPSHIWLLRHPVPSYPFFHRSGKKGYQDLSRYLICRTRLLVAASRHHRSPFIHSVWSTHLMGATTLPHHLFHQLHPPTSPQPQIFTFTTLTMHSRNAHSQPSSFCICRAFRPHGIHDAL